MNTIIPYGKAICYSGYRRGQSPKTEIPSVEQIGEDLQLLVQDGYRYLRMYDPNLHARRVLEAIRTYHLPMQCIIGIDSDPEVNNPNCPWEKQELTDEELEQNRLRNESELEKLIAMTKEFDDEIIAVSIGNENTPSWGAHMIPVERLMAHARRLKAALDKPVTFCEGVFEWPLLQELGDNLDFISVHSYPDHYGDAIKDALAVNQNHYDQIQKQFPDKQVIFTEVGWSTNTTDPEAKDRATVDNQKAYITTLNQWIESQQIVAFLFEAFDEPWKGSSEEASECNWGLYTVDRKKKW